MAESGQGSVWAEREALPPPRISAGTKQCLPAAHAWAAWVRDQVLLPGWSTEGQQKDQHQTPLSKWSAVHTCIPQSSSLRGRAIHEHLGELAALLPSRQVTGASTSPGERSGQGQSVEVAQGDHCKLDAGRSVHVHSGEPHTVQGPEQGRRLPCSSSGGIYLVRTLGSSDCLSLQM